MKNIEAEVRSFLTKNQYDRLLKFFKKNAKFVMKDNQVTYYFTGDHDLRIQKNDYFSKIWMKGGKIHDSFREELEIKFDKNNFELLEKLFLKLGYDIKVKWFRKRYQFRWSGIDVMLDYTRGYGYIIELEKMCSPKEQVRTYGMLKERFKELGIKLSPKEDFDKKFKYYTKNWKKLV